MSHGGLNILPKKSWNVWNRDNLDRVRRDEENFQKEEEKKRKRLEEIEQDKRFVNLKGRVAQAKSDAAERTYSELIAEQDGTAVAATATQSVPSASVQQGHINFFEDIDNLKSINTTNPEYEAEKKAKEEAEEKKVGLLTYLGESSAELATVKPWYYEGNAPSLPEAKKKQDDRAKYREDPMNDVHKLLGQPPAKPPPLLPHQERFAAARKSHKQEQARQPEPPKIEGPELPAPRKSIEQLRKERTERERKERERVKQLLAGNT